MAIPNLKKRPPVCFLPCLRVLTLMNCWHKA